jgi:nucleolar protein 56
MSLYFLHENAAGYALFEKVEFDETSTSLKQVQQAISSLDSFNKMIKLKSFLAFTSADQALSNMKSVAESEISEDLANFLEAAMAKSKKGKFHLAVLDKVLANKITERFEIPIRVSDAIFEMFRGIRLHFTHLLKNKNFTDSDLQRASLGLCHSFSRNKVTSDIARQDKHIIQTISLLDQIEKNLNQFCMRIKEWYSWHFPELAKIVNDNKIFVKLVTFIHDKAKLGVEALPELEEIVLDAGMAEKVQQAAASSMGQELSEEDMKTLLSFCERVLKEFEYRDELKDYLKEKMDAVAPNLTAFIGENVGAKLICQSGSLANLSKCPASTIQILGAEKALFRALKTRGNTPKYGLLYHSSYIGRAKTKDKGKISRYIANKCSLAARIDAYALLPTNRFGERMKEQVEDRLNFLETGKQSAKNIDAMKEVLDELKEENLYFDNPEDLAKKDKKKKKKKAVAEEPAAEEGKKKKKKVKDE